MHPISLIAPAKLNLNLYVKEKLDREKLIALLPGSRDQEISKILPEMLSVTKYFKNYLYNLRCSIKKQIILQKIYCK